MQLRPTLIGLIPGFSLALYQYLSTTFYKPGDFEVKFKHGLCISINLVPWVHLAALLRGLMEVIRKRV